MWKKNCIFSAFLKKKKSRCQSAFFPAFALLSYGFLVLLKRRQPVCTRLSVQERQPICTRLSVQERYLYFMAKDSSCQYSEIEELKIKWTPKKKSSLKLASSFSRLSSEYPDLRDMYLRKFYSVSSCGNHVQFAHKVLPDGVIENKGRLHSVYFCKNRLCPTCAWRRSLKISSQVASVVRYLEGKYVFLFVTLTVPNVPASELKKACSSLYKSYNRLVRYKEVNKVLKGAFRALEVTYNSDAATYHPHLHCIWAVPLGYFSHKGYISHKLLLELWKRACRDDSITQVDIRTFSDKCGIIKAVSEVAKYTVKSKDFLFPNDKLTDRVVKTLSDALAHTRLFSFSGCLKDAYIALNLDDAESPDADLIHINDKLDSNLLYLFRSYHWSGSCYQLANEFYAFPPEPALSAGRGTDSGPSGGPSRM